MQQDTSNIIEHMDRLRDEIAELDIQINELRRKQELKTLELLELNSYYGQI